MAIPVLSEKIFCACRKNNSGILYRIQNFDKIIKGRSRGSTLEAQTEIPKCCYAKIYAEYVKIFLDKEKVNVYNTKSMRKERLRYYEDKYIGNLI